MLTIPNEIVPLQMGLGVLADPALWDFSLSPVDLSLPRLRGRVGEGALLAVLGAIPSILDFVRAVGGLASRPVGRRLPCRVECAAQGLGEPTFTGDPGADLGNGRLAAARRCDVVPDGAPRAPLGRLAAGARLSIPRTDLLHHALARVSSWRTLRRVSNRPRDGATACGAGRPGSAGRTASHRRSPRRGCLARGNLGDQATRRRGLGPVARAADGGEDRSVHVTGPHRRPPGFTLDLWVAAVAVRCDLSDYVREGPPRPRL